MNKSAIINFDQIFPAIKYNSYLVADLFITVLLLPIILVFFAIVKFSDSSKANRVVLYGLDNVSAKTDNRGVKFRESGYEVTYFSFESTIGTLNPLEGGALKRITPFTFISVIQFLMFYLNYKPKYIEFYFIKNYITIYTISVIAGLNDILSIAILRGSETMVLWKKKPINRFFFKHILKQVDWILYRELWMKSNLDKIPELSSKVVFDPNKVRVNDFETPITRNFDTVFLNSFKKWRNIDILIDSLKIVVSKLPNSRHRIIGAKDEFEVEKYLSRIRELGIENNVRVETWTDKSKGVFEDSKIFVLPADIVFLNFSLLEAMERECAPIVWDVEGSDQIIQHGINGLISSKTESDLANNIINLIEDEDYRLKLGINARLSIVQNFNDIDRVKPILNLIKQN